MQRGSNRRRTESISRNDFGGKTGTTNDSISTWFSGFHEDLVTTVWIGNDDFSSLGEDEFGSTIALPIWVSFMEVMILSFLNMRQAFHKESHLLESIKKQGKIR